MEFSGNGTKKSCRTMLEVYQEGRELDFGGEKSIFSLLQKRIGFWYQEKTLLRATKTKKVEQDCFREAFQSGESDQREEFGVEIVADCWS